jgi:shikimate dehydrogenase
MAAATFTPDGHTRLYGLFGHPVHGSLSPALQNAGFRALGINALYLAFPVHPEQFAIAVRGLVAAGLAGFNLTVPFKLEILPLLESVTPEAQAIGAVNTVRCDAGPQGVRLTGTNTDGLGFLRSLERDLHCDPRGKRVLLLGAGGAARGIAHALLHAGAAKLWIANRTPDRAEALAAALRPAYPHAEVEALALDRTDGLRPQLLVNATTVGMGDRKSPVRLAAVQVEEAVADIVYHPAETPLLSEARSLGLACTNGIGMLLYQGCAALEFWLGRPAPEDAMSEALRAALRARQ